MSRPNALVVRGPGTNRDHDAAFALDLAGAEPQIVLVGELVERPELVRDARLIVVAGGFSYADALGAGRLLALDLTSTGLGEELTAFVAAGRPVLGICNGFQALVRSGLLPGAGRRVALGHNESGRFDCRWVRLAPRSVALHLDGGTRRRDRVPDRPRRRPVHVRRRDAGSASRRRPDRADLCRAQPERLA